MRVSANAVGDPTAATKTAATANAVIGFIVSSLCSRDTGPRGYIARDDHPTANSIHYILKAHYIRKAAH